MKPSVKLAADQMHLKDVYLDVAKGQTAVNPAESLAGSAEPAEPLDLLRLIQRAIQAAGLKQDALARAAKVNPGQMSSALKGDGHFSVRWLDTWPDEFWQEFLPLLRARKELSPEIRRRLLVEQFTTACRAMAQLFAAEVA